MPGVDVIEGLDNSGLTPTPAKVLAVRGQYFLEINKVRKPLPLGPSLNATALSKLAGSGVTALVSGKNIVAIALKNRRWTCYIPAPDIFKRINEELQKLILQEYVNAGVIQKDVAGRLANVS